MRDPGLGAIDRDRFAGEEAILVRVDAGALPSVVILLVAFRNRTSFLSMGYGVLGVWLREGFLKADERG